MLRLFVGIEFPPELKLAVSLLCNGVPGAKWVDPGNFHLTLRFIGDVDDTVAHEVAQTVPLAAQRCAIFISGWPISLVWSMPFLGRNFCVRPPKVSAA